jgi:nanoRNase/pAp phosphatase (c-di-AMP/oligoRNAs hydrolase)
MKPIVVLYHTNCPDGFGAAWAAWKKFGNKAEYVGVPATQDEDQLKGLKVKDKEVYFLDVCASEKELKKLVRTNRNVIVIDHHVSNKDKVRIARENIFDISHSGSVLSWKYFHPNKKIPLLLKYVEDNDIWRFKQPYSKEIGAALGLLIELDFKPWNTLVKKMENKADFKKILEQGKTVLAYEKRMMGWIIERAVKVKFMGFKVLAVNSSVLESDLGNILAEKCPPFGIVWRQVADGVRVSLRSTGLADVSKIARKFPGGGGHKKASGFKVASVNKLPWKIIKN